MQRYAERSVSQAEWLGYLPSHWECKKIGSLFTERKAKVSDQDYAPLSVTKMGILPQLEHAAKSNDGDNRKLVCAGDFVINSRSDRKGSCGVSELDGSVSLINLILTPRGQWNHRYVHYLLRSQPFSEEYYRNGRGIVADLWTTRYSEMKSILLPVPPRDEQDQIVRFLDWKVSRINKLISNYRHQIALLDELKQKRIDKAVIKGIRKSTIVHNDDIRWDIDYPEHWQIQRIRESFSFRKGLSITKANLEETGIAVISYGQVHSKKNFGVGLNKELIRYVHESYLTTNQSCLVEKGDFIFADTSEDVAGCGNCAYIDWDDTIFAGYHSIIAHHDGSTNSKYLAYLFKSPTWRYQILKKVNGVKVYGISQKVLKDIFVTIPTIDEQEEIISYLDEVCAKIDVAIKKMEEKIANLQDLKIRLVADTVTGKIDIRNITVPEYEYVEDTADDGCEEESEAKEGFYGEEE